MDKQDPQKTNDVKRERLIEIAADEALQEIAVNVDGVRMYRVMKIDKLTPAPLAVQLPPSPPPSPLRRTAITTGRWDAPPVECCADPVPNGLMTWLFPCATAAQIADRIGEPFWLWYAAVAVLVVGYEIAALAACAMSHTETHATFETTIANRSIYFYDDEFEPSAAGYVASALAIGVFAVLWRLRTLVRRKFKLPGTAMEDALRSAFCPCCSLAQMATHVKSYKRGACNLGRPDELPAYEFEA